MNLPQDGSCFCQAPGTAARKRSVAHAGDSSSDESPPVCWICRCGEDDEEDHGARDGALTAGGRPTPLSEALVRDRCCCRGLLAVVHPTCIDRWVIDSGHHSCGLCGATYVLEAADATGGRAVGTGCSQLLRRLHPWLLYAQYLYRVMGSLLVCAWYCLLRFGLTTAALHLFPVTLLSFFNWLSDRGGMKGTEVLSAVLEELFAVRSELERSVPLFLLRLCCHGWAVQLLGRYVRRAWWSFCHPQEARQREAARRRWREGVNQLMWAARWLETVHQWRTWWASPAEWPQWEMLFDCLLSAIWGLVGPLPTAAVVAAVFCSPEYHQPPPPPLLFEVDMEIVGVDLFDEDEHPPQRQQPQQQRPLNQSRRRRFGRQHRIRKGAYRTCVVVRGAMYAFMQRELVRWVHLGLAPLLTGMAAHVATSPLLSWRLDLRGRSGATGADAGAARTLLFRALAPTTVFMTVPPSPFEAAVVLGRMVAALFAGRASLGGAIVLAHRGVVRIVGFALSLSLLEVMGYWTAGVVVLWAATVLVVRPLLQVTMSAQLVTDRLGFGVTHPLDLAAVDRLVEFNWVRYNRRREWMGGANVLAWSVDTLLRVLPREMWRALCRCLTCLLLLLVGTSLVVAARLTLEGSGLVQSYVSEPGVGVTAMEAQPLSLWRLPPLAEMHEREAAQLRGASSPAALVPPPASRSPPPQQRGGWWPSKRGAAPLPAAPPPPPPRRQEDYTDTVGFLADVMREGWKLLPPVRAGVWRASMQLTALSANNTTTTIAKLNRTASWRAAAPPPDAETQAQVPWQEWVLTAAQLLWCAVFLQIYPWHYYWLRRLMPLYQWWGHVVLHLPITGPRSVLCDGQQVRRLTRWLRACQRRAAGVTAAITAPGPQLYHAVDAVLGWDPIRGGGAGAAAGYPHRLRIRQLPNRNDNEFSLARYARGVRAQQREARRRVRAEELAAAAERRRGRNAGAATRVPAPAPQPEPIPRPPRERKPFLALPVRYHRTVSDWLYGEVRAHFPSHAATPAVAAAQAPRANHSRLHPSRHRAAKQRAILFHVLHRMRNALCLAWYELRVALFVAGALVGTATYLGCVLALVFALLMDVVPCGLGLVGLCGVLGAAVSSPWTAVVTTTSFLLTPVMVLVLLGLEVKAAGQWLWSLARCDPDQLRAVEQALHPTRLTVGPYRRPRTTDLAMHLATRNNADRQR